MGEKINLRRLQMQLTHVGRNLTWPWLVSFGLLAACIAFYISMVMPARHTLTDIKAQLKVIQYDTQRLKQAAQGLARQAPAGQLDMFYQAFPTEKTVPDTLEQLISLAEAQSLNPKQAEYHIVRNHPGELLGYQVTLPIHGAYPKIMAFTFEMLSRIPNLSLDNISFHRQKIGDQEVDAVMWITLYIRRGRSIEY